MRKIKIFIGSSIDELKSDRIEIGNFFRQLNDLYLDNGLYFQLIMCEDYDDAIELEGKQSKYDKEILDSELSVFIFYKKIGVFTEHEFNVAYNQFKLELRPKILTVFKCASDTNQIIGDIKYFADKLDKELKHYYKTYSNSDSLKLWLIMQIKSMNLDSNKVEFKGGRVLINGETLAIYENAPAFCNHGLLIEKKNELKKIESEYLRLKVEYLENPDDVDVYVKYSEVVKRKKQIQEDIDNTEKNIVTQLENIYSITEKGELSERQTLGYRLIEEGKYDEALAVLDSDEIFSDVLKNERMIELGNTLLSNGKIALQTNVNEIIQRIEAITIKGVNSENAVEIENLYQKASSLAKKYSLDNQVFFKFAKFLKKQENSVRAIEVLTAVQEKIEKTGSWEEKVDLWFLLAQNFQRLRRLTDCYYYYEKALKTAEGLLSIDETKQNLERCGKLCYSYSILCGTNWVIDKTKEYVLQAIKYFDKLNALNSNAYVYNLASCYEQYAWVLGVLKSDALEYYRKAYLLVRDNYANLSALNEKDKNNISAIFKNYAIHLAMQQNDFSIGSESRQILDKAIHLVVELAKQNPVAYDTILAGYYQNYGKLIFDFSANESAEEYFLKSFNIYKKFIDLRLVRCEYLFALSAERLAKFYKSINDVEREKEYYKIAVLVYEKIGADENSFSKRNRAIYYYYAGMIYQRCFKNFKKCAIALKKSLDLYAQLDDFNKDDQKWVNYMHDDFKKYNLEKYLKED